MLHITAGTALIRRGSASGLQAAAQWVETSCPFLGLLLVVFFQQHFQGEAVSLSKQCSLAEHLLWPVCLSMLRYLPVCFVTC